jgi:hypothetical protein
MKTCFRTLLCILPFSMLAATAGSSPSSFSSFSAPYPLDRNPYPTQPGTRELPPRYTAPAGINPNARLAYWSEQAWRSAALDVSPPPAGPFAYAEQRGRTRSSRVMAIVHIAIYDGLNAIYKRYPGYSGSLPAFPDSLPDAAIAQAAHDVLAALYTRQADRLHAILNADLAKLPTGPGRGRSRAKQDLSRRALSVRQGPGHCDRAPGSGLCIQARTGAARAVGRPSFAEDSTK